MNAESITLRQIVKRRLTKEEEIAKESERIRNIKTEIHNFFAETKQLPSRRSPRKIKSLYKYMEKFSDTEDKNYDPEFANWLKSVGFTSFDQHNVTKTFKFRVYPSKSERDTYLRQMDLCRKIYNLLVEERRHASDLIRRLEESNPNYEPDYKNKSLYPDTDSQDHWLVELSKKNPNLPIFQETNSSIRTQICVQVNQAYRAFEKNLRSGKKKKNGKPYSSPRFKPEGEFPSMIYKRPNGYKFEWNGQSKHARIFGFPKLSNGIRINLMDLSPPDSIRMQSLVYDSGNFYLNLTIEVPKHKPETDRHEKIGIDLGIARTVQLSNGRFMSLPDGHGHKPDDYGGDTDSLKKLDRKVRKLQRQLSRKEAGGSGKRQSNNYKKANARISKIKRKISNTVKYYQAMWATEICREYDIVCMEKLSIPNMTKSAKGTVESPGKNVKQKAGLNRSILMTAPGHFISIMKNKAKEYGTKLVFVNPAYTSQTCSECGHVDKESRLDQKTFKCVKCGHEMNADHNAAINILNRGIDK